MRTIKFRGKKLSDGSWVYGSFVMSEDLDAAIYYQVGSGGVKKMDYVYVAPDTVGQFTGLYDKDGKEIYEGDIIMSDGDREAVYHELYYDENAASFCAALNGNKDLFLGVSRIRRDWIQRFEKRVIGNVHDNPELLTNE